MKLARPGNLGHFEWARARLHARIHRDIRDCPRCEEVAVERLLQADVARLREDGVEAEILRRL